MPKDNIPAMKTRLAREIEARRRDVCRAPAYPGGPEGYRFVPERCVPITEPAKRKRSTQRPFHIRMDPHDIRQAEEFLRAGDAEVAARQKDGRRLPMPPAEGRYSMLSQAVSRIDVIFANVVDPRSKPRKMDLLQRIKDACTAHGITHAVEVYIVTEIVCRMIVSLAGKRSGTSTAEH